MHRYAICVDKQRGSSDANVKIHPDYCYHYQKRKREAKTIQWYHNLTKKEAEKQAKSLSKNYGGDWRYAKKCDFKQKTIKHY